MRRLIIKKERAEGYAIREALERPLQEGLLEVLLLFRGVDRTKPAHAALRYKQGGEQRECYISLYPAERLGYCRSLSYISPIFKGKDEVGGGGEPAKYGEALVYTLSDDPGPAAASIDFDKLNQAVTRFSDLRPVGDNYNKPTDGSENLRFKYWSCLSFAACCTNPLLLCKPAKHNCTTIVADLLHEAGISTDLSTSSVWIRFFSLLAMSTTMAVGGVQVSTRRTVDLIGGGLTIGLPLAGLVLTAASTYRPKIFSCCTKKDARVGLNIKTNTFGITALVSVVSAMIIFSSTHFGVYGKEKNPGIFEYSLAGLGSVGLFLLMQLVGFCRDVSDGCTNPYGLKEVLNRGCLFSPVLASDGAKALHEPLLLFTEIEAKRAP